MPRMTSTKGRALALAPRTGRPFAAPHSSGPRLPALLNNRALCIGDSRFANGGPGLGSSRYYTGNGPVCFMLDGSAPTFDLQGEGMKAVGGSSTNEALAKLDADLAAYDASTVLLLSGANDGAKGMDAAATASATRAVADKVGAAGRRLIIIPTYPKSSGISTQAGADDYFARYVDQRDNIHPSRPWVRIADPWNSLVDPASPLRAPKAIYLPDGLHAEHEGNRVIWESALRPLLLLDWADMVSFPRRWKTADGVWSASNLIGSVTSNPEMTGTTGGLTAITNAGGTASGQAVTTWTMTATNMAGVNAVFSKGVDSDGYATQVIEFSGTSGATGPSFSFQQSVAGTRIPPGTRVGANCRVKIAGGHTGVRQVTNVLNIGGTGNAIMRGFSNQSPAQALSTPLARGFDRWMPTPTLVVAVNPTFGTFNPLLIDFLANSAISLRVEISRCATLIY